MDEPALFVSEAIDFRDAVQKAEDAQGRKAFQLKWSAGENGECAPAFICLALLGTFPRGRLLPLRLEWTEKGNVQLLRG